MRTVLPAYCGPWDAEKSIYSRWEEEGRERKRQCDVAEGYSSWNQLGVLFLRLKAIDDRCDTPHTPQPHTHLTRSHHPPFSSLYLISISYHSITTLSLSLTTDDSESPSV